MKNVVFIMADQLAAASLGCYGSGVDSTPNLDALAAQGVRFDRCYATTPVCAPNRANFLTGRSPCVHGMTTNNYCLPTSIPTYATVLKHAGYRTGGFGKFHQTPMSLPLPADMSHLGFDESIPSEDPKWGPWIEWVRREHPEHYEVALSMCWGPPYLDRYGPDKVNMRPALHAAKQKHLAPLKAVEPWHLLYKSKLPAELHDSTFIANCGIDFISRHTRDHADTPFFCHVSFVDPHDPYDPPAPYSNMYDPADMPPPREPHWTDKGITTFDSLLDFCDFRSIWRNREALLKLRAYYHGSLRFLDEQIGRVVNHIKEAGLWDDTIIVFTTDHGEHLGDHGLNFKGVAHYDMGIRCPLIVAGGGISAGHVSDRLTCTLDFFPTFCDWAAVPDVDRPPLEGLSFAPHADRTARDDTPAHRAVSVCFGRAQSVITDDGHRLTLYPDEGKGQLFNLRDDPDEFVDLYDDPAHLSTKARLLEQLAIVTDRPRRVPDYRDMSIRGGRKQYVAGAGGGQTVEGPPVYPEPSLPVWD